MYLYIERARRRGKGVKEKVSLCVKHIWFYHTSNGTECTVLMWVNKDFWTVLSGRISCAAPDCTQKQMAGVFV